MTRKSAHNEAFFHIRRDILVGLFLLMATLAVFWQVRNHEFVNFDDDTYVTENPHVRAGLTLAGITWAFATPYASNWHPLTWLSHMLDCHLFGLDPGRHHLTNLFFHTANTLLLLFVLRRMTGDFWRSAFVAALFALHPIHVESVAWVAERKDVLSTFFWILTMWSYVWYVEHPRIDRYLLVLLLFILGLMAKPMLVTLPFVFLLLDYWPLGRFQLKKSSTSSNIHQTPLALRLVWEKIPFLSIAAVSSIITFLVQKSGGAVSSLDVLPLHIRIANALVSYISYIGKMIWPTHMAPLYPHPGMIPMWQAAGAGLLIAAIFLLVIKAVRRSPYFAVGWLWYTGTLVPVIGIVQQGSQSMADRYSYVPLIGISIIIAWGVPELVGRWRNKEAGLAMIASTLLFILMAATWLQVRYWTNSITLFEHTTEVTSGNFVAHDNLGIALFRKGKIHEAINHYTEALRIRPYFEKAHNNLGAALEHQGKTDDAIRHYKEALRLDPDFVAAHNNIGVALVKQGKTDEAIRHYKEALRVRPGHVKTLNNLSVALVSQGKLDEATSHYSEVLRVNPGSLEAHINLGDALAKQGRASEAISHYSEALRLNPDHPKVHHILGATLAKQGKTDEAIRHYFEALRIKPDDAEVHNNLANALARHGRLEEAISHYSHALRIKPEYAEAHNNLGVALARRKRLKEAIRHFSEALQINPDFTGARKNLDRALQLNEKSNSAPNNIGKP